MMPPQEEQQVPRVPPATNSNDPKTPSWGLGAPANIRKIGLNAAQQQGTLPTFASGGAHFAFMRKQLMKNSNQANNKPKGENKVQKQLERMKAGLMLNRKKLMEVQWESYVDIPEQDQPYQSLGDFENVNFTENEAVYKLANCYLKNPIVQEQPFLAYKRSGSQ